MERLESCRKYAVVNSTDKLPTSCAVDIGRYYEISLGGIKNTRAAT
jgi:hypothetical protein